MCDDVGHNAYLYTPATGHSTYTGLISLDRCPILPRTSAPTRAPQCTSVTLCHLYYASSAHLISPSPATMHSTWTAGISLARLHPMSKHAESGERPEVLTQIQVPAPSQPMSPGLPRSPSTTRENQGTCSRCTQELCLASAHWLSLYEARWNFPAPWRTLCPQSSIVGMLAAQENTEFAPI